ncbi:carboxylate-amine ligase [Micromonospora halophytica]|uniref:Putative glutamate--cysteine ligase 2 n=1 Tax=Micromonospora halophytica TaxID=47864 RepID=A0A1C5IKU2_9ACTN|nr:glutamate--cysteine ligase [Micromonospora halophytica]SCG58925.1 carboxylate-amine ligase [Micromonospora halophytica]
MALTTRQSTPPPRFGVEEEFLVVDAVTRAPTPRAAEVVRAASPLLGERVSGEITTLQLETRTAACGTLGELAAQLAEARKVVADCARSAGLRVVATGTAPVAGVVPPPMTVGPRQTRGAETYRGLHDELALCALHVHVEMPSRQRALLVGNHLRPYLPTLLTLTANSPYWDNRDSGYASWRTTVWGRWPVAGPPPVFHSAAHYDEVVRGLLAAGALVDPATIFWDVRPSERHPTLEVRVADAAVTAEESARYAALVRALVVHLSAAVDAGEPAPDVPGELLRVAYWRAARDGLDGDGLDLRAGRLRPAGALVGDLLAAVESVLRAHGEHDLVAEWLDRLRADGTGARRQRSVARLGTLVGVVDHLAEQTAG